MRQRLFYVPRADARGLHWEMFWPCVSLVAMCVAPLSWAFAPVIWGAV